MFVPVVLIVLLLFYIYIYLSLGSTRVLAYCSFVLFPPPENDEGQIHFCKELSNKFLCNCSLVRMRFPSHTFKNTEQWNNWNKTIDSPLQPAPLLGPPRKPR